MNSGIVIGMNAAQQGLETLAKAAELGGITTSPYRLWLSKGQGYQLGTLTPDEDKYLQTLITRLGGINKLLPKQCFMNNQRIISEDRLERFSYVEGWWVNPTNPVLVTQHAWLVINGKGVDLTQEALKRTNPDRPDMHYFGLEIDRDTVMLNMIRTERYGAVMDDRENIRKLLTSSQ